MWKLCRAAGGFQPQPETCSELCFPSSLRQHVNGTLMGSFPPQRLLLMWKSKNSFLCLRLLSIQRSGLSLFFFHHSVHSFLSFSSQLPFFGVHPPVIAAFLLLSCFMRGPFPPSPDPPLQVLSTMLDILFFNILLTSCLFHI